MPEARNFKLTLAYDGRPYVGWQHQPNGTSVQEVLERAIQGICGEQCDVHGSGRTDSGVHAAAQVANVHVPTRLNPREFQRALNANLPEEIRIIGASVVPDDFHARYSAVEKTYRYLLTSGPVRSPFTPFYAHWIGYSLDLDAMRYAAQTLIGTYDFASFMASGSSVKTTVRTVKDLRIEDNGRLISILITADGFLRYMVRNIVGTLLEIGKGAMPPERMETILLSRDRDAAGPTAAAEGLTLLRVQY